jgi:predicted DNA-binding transcriptional regulator YafY
LILSYGADIKVVKPESLKECIKKVWGRAIKGNGSLEKNFNES